MAKVISVINNKGGVGKTTTTGILAELLGFLEYKTLCIDLDESSNLSMMFKAYIQDSEAVIKWREAPVEENITELFRYRYRTKEDVARLVRKTSIKNVSIIPSSDRHEKTPDNIQLDSTSNNSTILKRALATIKDDYDFILIDNAPASNILTVNSIFASDYILTPVRVEGFSYKGLSDTLDTIKYIKDEYDLEHIEFLGAFITQAKTNTNIYKDLNSSYIEQMGSKFMKTPIRDDIKVPEMETVFKPILEYAQDTNVVYDYSRLLIELNILPEDKKKILEYAIGESEGV